MSKASPFSNEKTTIFATVYCTGAALDNRTGEGGFPIYFNILLRLDETAVIFVTSARSGEIKFPVNYSKNRCT